MRANLPLNYKWQRVGRRLLFTFLICTLWNQFLEYLESVFIKPFSDWSHIALQFRLVSFCTVGFN